MAKATTNTSAAATEIQNPTIDGGCLPLPPYPQPPPLQPPTIHQPLGLQVVLARQIAAADDATYARELKWKAEVNGDTTKCEFFWKVYY